MKRAYLFTIFFLFPLCLQPQISTNTSADSILGHGIQQDSTGEILAWYKPQTPGAGYSEVVKLSSEFIKNAPVYEPLGLKMYYISCCFQGPHMTQNGDYIAEDWMHNPACIWAGLVQGLVLDYRVYSGDPVYISIVRDMLDYQIAHGTTPAEWKWGNVPFASADPFEKDYKGAGRWEADGMRGDGLHGIEPDKVGELGIAYLYFYQVTLEKRFLEAAVHCADALAKYVRDVRPEDQRFIAANTRQSPWPFRVNARTGVVISEYCSNVIEPIRLFDELLRIKTGIHLSAERDSTYRHARQIAWQWLYSINGPMKTFIWNGYFEDIPNDPDCTNRVQITPMETARYLIKHPALDPDINLTLPALIHWVSSAFSTEGMDAIKEQTWCYLPMGSHTSRYASLCALWYERTGDKWYKEQAERFFNFATYMCYNNGVVAVGPGWPSSWWSDGYGDYIRHFMEGIAAIPEWSPAGENHLLKSTSVIQDIQYQPHRIEYKTFDSSAVEVLRLTVKPASVKVNTSKINPAKKPGELGWYWRSLDSGGVLTIRHDNGNQIEILF